MRCDTGVVAANSSVVLASACGARAAENCSGCRNTNTAPAAMPSIASETAKKDRWYQVRTDSSRASSGSRSSVASVVKKRPTPSNLVGKRQECYQNVHSDQVGSKKPEVRSYDRR